LVELLGKSTHTLFVENVQSTVSYLSSPHSSLHVLQSDSDFAPVTSIYDPSGHISGIGGLVDSNLS